MKSVILTIAMAFIAFGAFGTSTSYAHCGVCEASMKSGEMKPCTKCMEAGKTCDCAKKKKCCGDCGKKAHKDHGEKPCKVCDKSEKAWNKKHKMHKSMRDHSEKGSLTIRSGTVEGDRYN